MTRTLMKLSHSKKNGVKVFEEGSQCIFLFNWGIPKFEFTLSLVTPKTQIIWNYTGCLKYWASGFYNCSLCMYERAKLWAKVL